jgi:VWFA-related protein
MTRWKLAVMSGLVAVTTLAAQNQTPQTVFRSRVDKVRVDALVTDRGRPIAGLTAADFELKDNGKVVTDVEVTPTTGSVGVAIALGLGGSARREGPKELVEACHALARALEPGDRAWLVTFGQSFALKVGPVADAAPIRQVLEKIQPQYGSAMWDAMFGAVSLAATHPGRSLVLLFTDGVDRNSWLKEERAVEVLRRADVVVSGVRPAGVLYGFNALEAAARTTGGVVFYAERGRKLDAQFVDLLSVFRQGYVLSYTPPSASKDGWHEIDVKLKNRKATVRARQGYYEPGR